MIKESFKDMKLDHSFVQSKPQKSRQPKIKKAFSFPLRLWKAACLLLLVAVIPVFAASQHGKEALSKLKALVPPDFQVKHYPVPQEPTTLKEKAYKMTKDLPKAELTEMETVFIEEKKENQD